MRARSLMWAAAAAPLAALLIATMSAVAASQDTSVARSHPLRPPPIKVILTVDESGAGSGSDSQLLSDIDLGLNRAFALDTTVAFNTPRRTGEIVAADAYEPLIEVHVWLTHRFGTGPYATTVDWRVEASVPGVHPASGSTARGGSGNAAAQRVVVDVAQAIHSMAAALRQ